VISIGMRLAVIATMLVPFACPCVGQDGHKANPADQVGQPMSGASTGSKEEANRASSQPRDSRYQLHPGDSLAIIFPRTPEFNQPSVAIQPDGYVTLQGIGEIPVAGKTLPEFRQLLQTAYAKIVSPQTITVEPKDFEKPYFLVGGEVGHPGKFELRSDTTVAAAVAIAGGFKDSSKHSQVLLFRRVSDEWMQAKILDMKKMLASGNLGEDPHLRPGDMIYVPKNALSKIKPFLPVTAVGAYWSPIY
jgi:protein involved in polysaccharide export with SLBB domain